MAIRSNPHRKDQKNMKPKGGFYGGSKASRQARYSGENPVKRNANYLATAS